MSWLLVKRKNHACQEESPYTDYSIARLRELQKDYYKNHRQSHLCAFYCLRFSLFSAFSNINRMTFEVRGQESIFHDKLLDWPHALPAQTVRCFLWEALWCRRLGSLILIALNNGLWFSCLRPDCVTVKRWRWPRPWQTVWLKETFTKLRVGVSHVMILRTLRLRPLDFMERLRIDSK